MTQEKEQERTRVKAIYERVTGTKIPVPRERPPSEPDVRIARVYSQAEFERHLEQQGAADRSDPPLHAPNRLSHKEAVGTLEKVQEWLDRRLSTLTKRSAARTGQER